MVVSCTLVASGGRCWFDGDPPQDGHKNVDAEVHQIIDAIVSTVGGMIINFFSAFLSVSKTLILLDVLNAV